MSTCRAHAAASAPWAVICRPVGTHSTQLTHQIAHSETFMTRTVQMLLVSIIGFALLAAPARAADEASAKLKVSLDKGLAFLKTKQQPDGSWQTSPRDPPGVSALVL